MKHNSEAPGMIAPIWESGSYFEMHRLTLGQIVGSAKGQPVEIKIGDGDSSVILRVENNWLFRAS